jgi:hypothetical protein
MIRTIVSAIAITAFQLPLSSAEATHQPNDYCSESGDVCASTAKVDGLRKLRITTAAQYFENYRLCVTAPDDSKECKKFKIEQSGSGYADSVRWKKHFPNKGGGAYTVQWKAGGENVTPKLGFHVKD